VLVVHGRKEQETHTFHQELVKELFSQRTDGNVADARKPD